MAGAADPSSKVPALVNWDSHRIVQTFTADTKQYEGRTLGEIAMSRETTAFDALCDLALADGLRTYFAPSTEPASRADWMARAKLWTDERAVIGGSDAGAHLNIITTYNYTTQLLKMGVREEGLIPLERAIHLITEVPARLYGAVGRGRLKEGSVADLVIFDENTVGPEPARIVNDLPGGAERLSSGAIGIGHVVVAGREIVHNGSFTHARPGRVLRSGIDLASPALN